MKSNRSSMKTDIKNIVDTLKHKARTLFCARGKYEVPESPAIPSGFGTVDSFSPALRIPASTQHSDTEKNNDIPTAPKLSSTSEQSHVQPGNGVSIAPKTSVRPDFWDQAYADLRKSDERLIEDFKIKLLSENVPVPDGTNRKQVNETLEQQVKKIVRERSILTFCGHSMEIRKQVHSLVHFIQMSKPTLNAIGGMGPIYAGIPITTMCLLVSFLEIDGLQREAAVSGLLKISRIIFRFTRIEKSCILDDIAGSTAFLRKEMIKLYRYILEFQIRAVLQHQRATKHQFARNLVKADSWESLMNKIDFYESSCTTEMADRHNEEQKKAMAEIERMLREADVQIQDKFEQMIGGLNDLRNQQQAHFNASKESDCFAVLRTMDYEFEMVRIKTRVNGTCEWFLGHAKYQSWLKSAGPSLPWVTADPGCGKSVLAKHLVASYSQEYVAGPAIVC